MEGSFSLLLGDLIKGFLSDYIYGANLADAFIKYVSAFFGVALSVFKEMLL